MFSERLAAGADGLWSSGRGTVAQDRWADGDGWLGGRCSVLPESCARLMKGTSRAPGTGRLMIGSAARRSQVFKIKFVLIMWPKALRKPCSQAPSTRPVWAVSLSTTLCGANSPHQAGQVTAKVAAGTAISGCIHEPPLLPDRGHSLAGVRASCGLHLLPLGATRFLLWEDTQVPRFSSSEDESPSAVTRTPLVRTTVKHSTPEEAALGCSLRPPGGASHLGASPMPAHSSLDLITHLVGVSPVATFRKRRLSTIRASTGSQSQSGPDPVPLPPGKEPPASASSAQQQKGQSHGAKSWPRNSGLPGISNTAKRKRRDPKKWVAAMERVQQWEAHLLQSIEEATQHELTIEDD
ncbi:coiled-coil domain-containing protein 201 [Cynocephalus volans]|uniref:coiled-coil domain-containing protein 201 n=1 Tax=Cynocephalus volans TaxID=110931 RepID=UPI002FCB0801